MLHTSHSLYLLKYSDTSFEYALIVYFFGIFIIVYFFQHTLNFAQIKLINYGRLIQDIWFIFFSLSKTLTSFNLINYVDMDGKCKIHGPDIFLYFNQIILIISIITNWSGMDGKFKLHDPNFLICSLIKSIKYFHL